MASGVVRADGQVLRLAKVRAAEVGVTLRAVVDYGLRAFLAETDDKAAWPQMRKRIAESTKEGDSHVPAISS